jgi:hypothetical protein
LRASIGCEGMDVRVKVWAVVVAASVLMGCGGQAGASARSCERVLAFVDDGVGDPQEFIEDLPLELGGGLRAQALRIVDAVEAGDEVRAADETFVLADDCEDFLARQ